MDPRSMDPLSGLCTWTTGSMDPSMDRAMDSLYRVYKKTEQIWNCSQFRKTAISIQFFMYIASLGTYNVE
jgi:hypothetical protein